MKYKKGLDSFWLKIFAIFGMTLDHIGITFGDYIPIWAQTALYALGGLTFPIMAFMLCEGYRHTRNVKRYILRLLLFTVIAQVPYAWAFDTWTLSIMFTLLLALLALHATVVLDKTWLKVLICVVLSIVSVISDWNLIGIPMVLLYYYVKGHWGKLVYPIILPIVIMGLTGIISIAQGYNGALPQMAFVLVGCSLTVPLLHMYNGKRGRSIKYLFYIYYPSHLIVLAVLRGLIFSNWGILN